MVGTRYELASIRGTLHVQARLRSFGRLQRIHTLSMGVKVILRLEAGRWKAERRFSDAVKKDTRLK